MWNCCFLLGILNNKKNIFFWITHVENKEEIYKKKKRGLKGTKRKVEKMAFRFFFVFFFFKITRKCLWIEGPILGRKLLAASDSFQMTSLSLRLTLPEKKANWRHRATGLSFFMQLLQEPAGKNKTDFFESNFLSLYFQVFHLNKWN